MATALEIAQKILKKASTSDSEDLISNLKLQKLLYYIQGFHLAYFGTPLFEEDIEAWAYGPVVPSVYNEYKEYKNRGIEYTGDVLTLKPKEERLFDEVYRVYGAYSAIGLMEMTHKETPWKTTEMKQTISKDKLKNFFKTRLK